MYTTRTMLGAALLVLSTSAAAMWEAVLPATIPDPIDNITSPEKVTLGNALYFDTRLSSDGTIACASCHLPNQGGDDNLPTSPGVGIQIGTRNAQTVLNAGLMSAQFWDGREPTLEEQAKAPFINPVEMGNASHADVETTVQGISGYAPLFEAAFGMGAPMDIDNIAKAIAAFQRTLLTPNSPFDDYVNGNLNALTANQIAGKDLFENKNCIQCHADELLAKQNINFPDQPFRQKFPKFASNTAFIAFDATYDLTSDLGIGALNPPNPSLNNFWKVQSLRNIAETGPYFHNGSVTSLDEAVRIMAAGQLNITLTPTEVGQIVDFLGTLTGDLPNPTPVTVTATPAPLMSTGIALLLAFGLSVFGFRRLR